MMYTSDIKKYGFTLAEVLITLAIIGVVVAMTIPTLISNIQDKIYKSAFKKQYSLFAQAMERVYLEYGTTYKETNWDQMPIYLCQISQQLKTVEAGLQCDKILANPEIVIPTYNRNLKWHRDEKWYDKNGNELTLNGGYISNTFKLADGALINYNCFRYVFIDVNGFNKPNTVGRDIFYFVVNENNGLSFWSPNYNTPAANVNGCSSPLYNTLITKDNYKDDCENGSGWGCSVLYMSE